MKATNVLLPNVCRREVIAFVLIVTVGVLILFLRNPDPIFSPVLVTEDAAWATGLLFGDRVHAYLHARPDYPVLGQVLLLDAAVQLSRLVSDGTIARLPQMVAWLSYLFWAVFSGLAFSALRPWLPMIFRFLFAILILLLPIGWHMNEILGRISNLGYLFLPLSFFLILLREAYARQKWSWIIVTGLILCIFTNPICVALVGIHIGFRAFRRLISKEKLSLLGDMVLCSAIIALAAIILTHHGQGMPYDEEIRPQYLVELLIARSVLFPFVFPLYVHLNDIWAIVCLIVYLSIVAVALLHSQGRQRGFGSLLAIAAVGTSVLMLVMRPLLTHHLTGYGSTFPDRYYMAQNIFAALLFVWALSRLPRPVGYAGIVFVAAIFTAGASDLFQYAAPSFRLDLNGTFADHVAAAVEQNPQIVGNAPLRVDVYPEGWWMQMPADLARATAAAAAEWQRGPVIRAVDLGRIEAQTTPDTAPTGLSLHAYELELSDINDLVPSDGALKPSGIDPYVVLTVPAQARSISNASFSFIIECTSDVDVVPMQLFWTTTERPVWDEAHSLFFQVTGGRHVVPLDTHPAWTGSGSPAEMRLDFAQPGTCEAYRLAEITLSSSR